VRVSCARERLTEKRKDIQTDRQTERACARAHTHTHSGEQPTHTCSLLLGAGAQACAERASLVCATADVVDMPPSSGPNFARVYQVAGGGTLAVGERTSGTPPECWAHFDAVINVSCEHSTGMPPEVMQPRLDHGDLSPPSLFYLQLDVPPGKKDPRALERHLPKALRFASFHLLHHRRILVHSDLGNDRAVAVAIAILMVVTCLHADKGSSSERLHTLAAMVDEGDMRALVRLSPQECKASVTRCLHLVSLGWPRAAPPRHTLKKLLKFFSEGYLK